MSLEGKKIIIISVSFFNYEKLIKKELESRGAEVDIFDERPSNSTYAKAIIRLKRSAYQIQINQYYQKLLEEIQTNSYDYFLLIKGEVIPDFFVEKLKVLNPQMILIYYNYDSFANNPNAKGVIKYFNRKFSFDPIDSKRFGMQFRPLFFADDYEKIRTSDNKVKYEAAFIGTAHSDRYLISEKVKRLLLEQGLKMFTFYYFPSKMVLKIQKLYTAALKPINIRNVSFKSLLHQEIIKIYEETHCILDINHPGQTGLTMRTFETLGAGRKLITTNEEIKKYPFFNDDNVLIVNRHNLLLDPAFFRKPYQDLGEDMYRKMSLKGWVDEVFIAHTDYWKTYYK